METAFEVIDHTADIGIIAYGANVNQLFVNASLGMSSLIIDTDSINEHICRNLELSSQDTETLLVEWLNELIYIYEVEHIIFRKFEIELRDNCHLQARCYGESITPYKHTIKREIKAATYHMLNIHKTNNRYQAELIFDI